MKAALFALVAVSCAPTGPRAPQPEMTCDSEDACHQLAYDARSRAAAKGCLQSPGGWGCEPLLDDVRRAEAAQARFKETARAHAASQEAERSALQEQQLADFHRQREAARAAADEELRRQHEEMARRHEAEVQARTARARAIQEAAATPEHAIPVLSFRICRVRDVLRGLAEDRARMAQVDAASGTVNLQARRDIAEMVIDHESQLAALTTRLRKQFAVGPTSCSDPHVLRLTECASETGDRPCEEPFALEESIIDAGYLRHDDVPPAPAPKPTAGDPGMRDAPF